ncbi:MAG: hypothetical protein HYS56_03525, partial [Candidatus Omnitrophica bacterium]|nr:hypothetical protein [Candidatus Omnitrophota bacterium]
PVSCPLSPVYAEASKSAKYTLEAGGFTAGGATNSESATIKAQAGAIGDFAGTTTSSESTVTTVNPGLIQVLTAEEVDTSYPFDIKEVFAKESLTGQAIQPSLWQKDNDPHFYWTVYGPVEGVIGYSFALDAIPDEVMDVADSGFSYAENDIADGKHIFRVIAQSNAGKWGREGGFEIWVDATSPSVISFTPGNKVLMNYATPQIQIDLKDEASGADPDSIVLKVNRSQVETVFDSQSQRVSYTPASPLREGSNSITFDVQDQAKNVTAALIWSFTIDTQPPSGQVTLNNGDATTTSITVKIDIEAEDATTSVKEMMIGNQPDFAGGRWEPFSVLKDSWQLAPVSGERTVYVKFKDEAGNESIGYSDSIELVIIAPETTITGGPSGVTEETTATFTYSASEPDASFRYQIDAEEWSDWTTEALAAFSDLKQGNHYFNVKAGKDVDGNGVIDPDEEDPTPATRTWSISASGGTEAGSIAPEKPVKYWYKE